MKDLVESLAHSFFQSQNRLWYVGGITLFVLLILGLPAYDSLRSKSTECGEIQTEIASIQEQSVDLERLRTDLDTVLGRVKSQEGLDGEQAVRIRDSIVQLVRKLECQLVNIQLGETRTANWTEGTDPLGVLNSVSTDTTEFQLETTGLKIAVIGELRRLVELTGEVQQLHRLAVPTAMELQQVGQDSDQLQLDIELTLLNLSRSKQTS
ncbi:MAG: hypothetical protein KDB03_25185 [Planctomycetales bacterium]|nr:hypothetical protein [Planctomycetales bacterium]